MRLDEIAGLAGGRLSPGAENVVVAGIATDSRAAGSGNLFVALHGENADGHRFVLDALKAGAAAALVNESWYGQAHPETGAFVLAADPLLALGEMGSAYRRRFDIPVIAITGSMGKTSTREMLGALLRVHRNPLVSRANFNTEIGLPITLLDLTAGHDLAVVEMAMRGSGQIAGLCHIARPTAAIITNIGLTHVELLGSQENIAAAKAELLQGLPGEAWSVLNADDAYFDFLCRQAPGPVVSFGSSEGAGFRATDIVLDESGCACFTLNARGQSERVRLSAPGEFHVMNALAATAAACRFGVTLAEAARALADYQGFEKRTRVYDAPGGWKVFDDTYNANPSAMSGALASLAAMAVRGRRIAVLGDMRELGDHTEAAHRAIGERITELKPDILVTVGDSSAFIAETAEGTGYQGELSRYSTSEEASVHVASMVRPGDVVLVKGSRALEMEKIVERLL